MDPIFNRPINKRSFGITILGTIAALGAMIIIFSVAIIFTLVMKAALGM